MSPDKEYAQQICLQYLKSSRSCAIAEPFIHWIVFCKLWSGPKIKFLWWATSVLEKSFQFLYSNTHLNSHETVPLTTSVQQGKVLFSIYHSFFQVVHLKFLSFLWCVFVKHVFKAVPLQQIKLHSFVSYSRLRILFQI